MQVPQDCTSPPTAKHSDRIPRTASAFDEYTRNGLLVTAQIAGIESIAKTPDPSPLFPVQQAAPPRLLAARPNLAPPVGRARAFPSPSTPALATLVPTKKVHLRVFAIDSIRIVKIVIAHVTLAELAIVGVGGNGNQLVDLSPVEPHSAAGRTMVDLHA